MPIRISKKAQKVLTKSDEKAGIKYRPPPPRPASTDPEADLQFALQLFSVKGGTLMMVRKRDGKVYRVKAYNAGTRRITLVNVDLVDHEFETTYTAQTGLMYGPLWRS